MDIQTIAIIAVILIVGLLAVKKFKGGCCGGMKKDAGEKHEHDGGCCGHKH